MGLYELTAKAKARLYKVLVCICIVLFTLFVLLFDRTKGLQSTLNGEWVYELNMK